MQRNGIKRVQKPAICYVSVTEVKKQIVIKRKKTDL